MSTETSFENLQTGDIFNQRWRIVRKLGKGGFGIVYQALDLNIEDREVAIKILTVDTIKYPDALTRFKKEASITSKLKSPNTLVIYDFGVIHQYAYMVSELLIGETLEDRINHKRFLRIEECLNIIKFVAQALQEAHLSNIVHRDIKPDNIFLNQTKDGYEVKLIDFGIAKVVEATSKATATQSFFGTPLYMSPEQIKDASKVDTRTDIYSLGLVLYHCIVGKPPFEAEDFYQLLKQQVEKNVPLIAFNHKKYEMINHLIALMTEKNPSQRMQTMKEVIDYINWIQSQFTEFDENDRSTLFQMPTDFEAEFTAINHFQNDQEEGTPSLSLKSTWKDADVQHLNASKNKVHFVLLAILLLGVSLIFYLSVNQNQINQNQTASAALELKPDLGSTQVQLNQPLIDIDSIENQPIDVYQEPENQNPKSIPKVDQPIQKIELTKYNDPEKEKTVKPNQNTKQSSTDKIKQNTSSNPNYDLTPTPTPTSTPTSTVNTANKNKSAIYDLIDTKMKGIKKCINLYQSDFDAEFLNLNLDFQAGNLQKLKSSSLDDQALRCIKKLIDTLNFSDDIVGSVNIKLLLPVE